MKVYGPKKYFSQKDLGMDPTAISREKLGLRVYQSVEYNRRKVLHDPDSVHYANASTKWLYEHGLVIACRNSQLFWEPIEDSNARLARYGLVGAYVNLFDQPKRKVKNGFGTVIHHRTWQEMHEEESRVTGLPLPEKRYSTNELLNWTDEQIEAAVEQFLDDYEETGAGAAASRSQGIPYTRMMTWVLRRKDWQDRMKLANWSINQRIVDKGKEKALGGSDNMIKFFLEREMPERYGVGKMALNPDRSAKVADEVDNAMVKALESADKAAKERMALDSGVVKHAPAERARRAQQEELAERAISSGARDNMVLPPLSVLQNIEHEAISGTNVLENALGSADVPDESGGLGD